MSYNPGKDDEVYHQLRTSPQEFDINNFQIDSGMLQQNGMDSQDYQQRIIQTPGANYQYQGMSEPNIKVGYSEAYQGFDNPNNTQVSYDYVNLDQQQYPENQTGNGLSLNTQSLPQFNDNDFLSPTSQLSHLSPVNKTNSNPQNDFLQVQQNQIDRKSTRLNSSHIQKSRMPSSA